MVDVCTCYKTVISQCSSFWAPSTFIRTSPSQGNCSGIPPPWSVASCGAATPTSIMKNKTYRPNNWFSPLTSWPPRSSLPQNNYFLITYQTCHHYHGDNKANHNYYSYEQAGPVPWAMKVNMIMCVIMVITYCFIPILYEGFVHGCCSWTAKQANCSKPQSLYTLTIPRAPSSSSSHCFTQYLMTSHTCCLVIWIPPDPYNNSLNTHRIPNGWMFLATDNPQMASRSE